uniref:Uncharacterized protein n=1 Tax=Lutzomyia longipalpis TaxID=7200 RepID=A0A7G3B4D7_LUTLO
MRFLYLISVFLNSQKIASSSSSASSSAVEFTSGSLSVLRAFASISRHLRRIASVIELLEAGKLVWTLPRSFSLSSRLLSFLPLLLLDDFDEFFDELLDDSLPCGVTARKRFQFLISVFDRLITSSSLLLFRNSFTVIPIRVLVKISKSTLRVWRAFSKSSACSCPVPSGEVILLNFF